VLGVVAMVDYLLLYAVAKRRSVYGTIVGSVAGALPITAGYTAVTGSFDVGALLLFLILALWQMPHFYAIAMFRLRDYRAADIPVLPAVDGLRAAKTQIVVYVVAFYAVVALLAALGYVGWVYLAVMTILSAMWLAKGLQGFRANDDERWARKMFGFSLIVLLAFSFLIATDSFLI
jgi:heme o synthase